MYAVGNDLVFVLSLVTVVQSQNPADKSVSGRSVGR